jgi:hypothetical protein
MRLQENLRKNRVTLYTIGASILLLALMAFSGLCLGVVRVCSESDTLIVNYWEVVGLSGVSLIGTMMIRSFGRSRRDDFISFSTQSTQLEHRQRQTPSRNWRELYSQLSADERRKMKEMLNPFCESPGKGDREAEKGEA